MSVKEIAMRMTLKSLPHLKELLKSEEMQSNLCQLLSESDNAYQVMSYLEEERQISPKNIFHILTDFVGNADIKKKLKQNLDVCWFKYKLFDLMNLMRQTNEESKYRQEISNYVDSIYYPYSDFDQFVTKCFLFVDRKLTNTDINRIKLDLASFKSVQALFAGLLPPVKQNPNKSIEEHFADMLRDYDYLPNQSVRKELQKEMILTFLECHPQARKTLDNHSPFKQNASKIAQPGHLQTKIRRQFGNEASEAIRLLQECRNANGDKQRQYGLLCSVKSILFGIDVLELQRLIAKTKEAKKVIEGKDVILFMGATGSGKTTTILKFLGYSMKEASYKLLPTLVPVQQIASNHKTFYTSPQGKSCTRYINAVPIPSNMYPKGISNSRKNFVICDSPGFGDSEGSQIDIANGVGVINALCECNSVRIVLILPHNSLIADRVAGAVKVSETISGLFNNFQEISKSITILFNKVPVNEQKRLPKLLLNKIMNLTSAEKVNDKIELMMQIIQDASQNQQNYLDPLGGDYRKLLSKIMEAPAVNDPRQYFVYNFAQPTKHAIDIFTIKYERRVHDYFNKHRYSQASLELQLLNKMSQILYSNSAMKNSYYSIARHIQNTSQQLFKVFEKILESLQSEELSEKKEIEMVTAKKWVLQIQEHFREFYLQTKTAQNIQQLVTSTKQKFQNQLSNIEESSQSENLFTRIRAFSTRLCPEFANVVVSKMENQSKAAYLEAIKAADSKDCESLQQAIKKLSVILSRVKIISESNKGTDMMDMLKYTLQCEFQKSRDQIKARLLNHNLYESDMKYCKENMKFLHTIRASNLLVRINPKKEIANLISVFESRGKAEIGNFQCKLIEITDIKTEDYNSSYVTAVKGLSTLEKQMQMILSFENSEILKNEYENMRQTVFKQLEINCEALCQFLKEMKERKNFDTANSIDIVKSNITVLIKSCNLMKEEGEEEKIRKEVVTQWQGYLSQENRAFSQIELRLGNYKDNFTRIEKFYIKLRAYEKLSQIGREFECPVNDLKLQFYEKLQAPFKEYLRLELPNLQSHSKGFLSHNSVERFNKFCFLAQRTEDLVSSSEYARISSGQNEIMDAMKAHIQQLKSAIIQFCDTSKLDQKRHEKIREPLKVLVMINEKEFAKRYINIRLEFDTEDELARLRQELVSIHGKIDQSMVEFVPGDNIEKLINLINQCKQYKSLETLFHFKEESQRINFQDLEKRLTLTFGEHLKNDEESARRLIRNNKPSQILFPNLKAIYKQFLTVKQVAKRGVIINELKYLQDLIIKGLKAMKSSLSQDSNLLSNKSLMFEHFQNFEEALILSDHLQELYQDQQDKRTILVDDYIREVGKKVIIYYQQNFESAIYSLRYLKFQSAEKKIQQLQSFQSIINDLKCFKSKQEYPQNKFQELASEAKYARESLLLTKDQLLVDCQTVQNEEELTDFLKQHCNYLKQKMKQKYHTYSPNYTIDSQFKTYYMSLVDSQSQKQKQTKKLLESYVSAYFSKIVKEFKETQISNEEDICKSIIQRFIQILPNQLMLKYKAEWEKTKKNAQYVQQRATPIGKATIEQVYDIFLDNYSKKNEDSFLIEFLRQQFSNNKQEMLNKMIQTNAFTNQESSFWKQVTQGDFFIRRLKKEILLSGEIVKYFLRELRKVKEETANNDAKAIKPKRKKH